MHLQQQNNTTTGQGTCWPYWASIFLHIRQVARATAMTRSMIYHHIKRDISKCKAQYHRQQLSPDEEHTLAKWIWCLSVICHAIHHSFLCKVAEKIQKPHITTDDQVVDLSLRKIGKHWISWFLACNTILQSKVTKNIETACKEITEAQLEN